MINNLFDKGAIILFRGLLFSSFSYAISFGIKIDGFGNSDGGKLNRVTAAGPVDPNTGIQATGNMGPVIIGDTEIAGIKRSALQSAYSFQDIASDPLQTNLHYSGSRSNPSKIVYTLGDDFNLNLNNTFRLNFTQVNKPFSSRVVLTSATGTVRTSNLIQVDSSNIHPSINLMDPSNFIDSGESVFNPARVGDFQFIINADMTPGTASAVAGVVADLDSLEVVPEPFSMMILGTGVAGLVKRRKNKLVKKKFLINFRK